MRKLFIGICSASVAAALVGCGSAPAVPQVAYIAPIKIIHLPPINTEAEAEIGQTIISTANFSNKEAVVLEKDVSEYKKSDLLNNRWSGTTMLRAGTLEKRSETAEGSFFRDDRATFSFSTGLTSAVIPCDCGIFIPKDQNKPPVIYTYHREIGSAGYDFGVGQIKVKPISIEAWGKDSFKRELIYGGVSGNSISISYREFSDGIARPAFTQELKYDLTDSKIIGYRGARFEVIKASNTSLKYKMLKALD